MKQLLNKIFENIMFWLITNVFKRDSKLKNKKMVHEKTIIEQTKVVITGDTFVFKMPKKTLFFRLALTDRNQAFFHKLGSLSEIYTLINKLLAKYGKIIISSHPLDKTLWDDESINDLVLPVFVRGAINLDKLEVDNPDREEFILFLKAIDSKNLLIKNFKYDKLYYFDLEINVQYDYSSTTDVVIKTPFNASRFKKLIDLGINSVISLTSPSSTNRKEGDKLYISKTGYLDSNGVPVFTKKECFTLDENELYNKFKVMKI